MFAKPQLNGESPEAFTHELLNVAEASDNLVAALRGLRGICLHGRSYQHSQTPALDRTIDLQEVEALMRKAKEARTWAEAAFYDVA